MICKTCGTEILEGHSFCHKCGAKYVAEEKKGCIYCGTELAEGQKFCHKCGRSQEPKVVVEPDVVKEEPKKSEPKAAPTCDCKITGTMQGFVFTFFMGVLGLLACQCLGDEPAKKAAWKTFFIMLIVVGGLICLSIISTLVLLLGGLI